MNSTRSRSAQPRMHACILQIFNIRCLSIAARTECPRVAPWKIQHGNHNSDTTDNETGHSNRHSQIGNVTAQMKCVFEDMSDVRVETAVKWTFKFNRQRFEVNTELEHRCDGEHRAGALVCVTLCF